MSSDRAPAKAVTDVSAGAEAALVAALQRGERQAFQEAVSRYSPRLLATARAIAGADAAPDLVQDAWVTVFQRIGSFEGRSSLGTWLQRIVANGAISYVRARAREPSRPDQTTADPMSDRFDERGRWLAPPADWNAASPDELLAAADLRDCIDKHLRLMPDRQRQVLVLRDLQALPLQQICNDLGLSASNARVLLHRARARLMNMVDHFQDTGSC